MSKTIRAPRYVSCAAGTYPAPVPPGGDPLATNAMGTEALMAEAAKAAALETPAAAPEFAQPAVDPAAAAGVAHDPAATMALDAQAARAAIEAPPAETPIDPQAEETFEPSAPAAESIPDPASLDATQPVPSDVAAAAIEGSEVAGLEPVRKRRLRPVAMLLGLLLGGSLGTIAGLGLLASSTSESLWTSLQDPIGLWNAVGDPMLRISAGLVAGGFAVLGVALAVRRSRS